MVAEGCGWDSYEGCWAGGIGSGVGVGVGFGFGLFRYGRGFCAWSLCRRGKFMRIEIGDWVCCAVDEVCEVNRFLCGNRVIERERVLEKRRMSHGKIKYEVRKVGGRMRYFSIAMSSNIITIKL